MGNDSIESSFAHTSEAYVEKYGIRVSSDRQSPRIDCAARRVESLFVMQADLDNCEFVKVPGAGCMEWAVLALLVFVSGDGRISYGGNAPLRCSTGDVFLLPLEDSYKVTTEKGTQLYVVAIGEDSSVLRFPHLVSCIGDSVHPTDLFPVRMLTSYIGVLVDDLKGPANTLVRVVERHLAELVAMAFPNVSSTKVSMELGKASNVRLSSILEFMRAHIHDPDLNIGTVAHHLNISGHYVRKLFYDAQTSFTAYATDLRLKWAYQRLATTSRHAERVSDIAYQAGFNNLGWFNRAFKKKFGVTPSAVRMETSESSQ